MKARRILIPLVTLLLVTSLKAADEAMLLPEKFLPRLDALLKQAATQSPRMINRAMELEIAENNRIQARSGLLPSAGGSANFLYSYEDRNDGTGFANVNKFYYNVSVNQPLYHWGARKNTDKIGEIQLKIAQGNHQEGYRLLAQEIRTSYLQLIAKKAYAERIRLSEQYQQDLLKQGQERLAKNAASESEVFTLKVNADRAQLEAERFVLDYENAKQSLARLTGSVSIQDSDISGAIPEIVCPSETIKHLLAAFLAQKEPQAVELFTARSQLEIEKLNYLIAKTSLRPKFNLTLGTSQDDQSYTRDVGQRYQLTSYFAGVTAGWTLFDGFASSAATRSALLRRRQAEKALSEATEAVARQAQTQAKQLDFLQRNLDLTNRMLGAAKGVVAVREADFSRGVVSEADVSVSRIGQYDARIVNDNARIEYLVALTSFLGFVSQDPAQANLAQEAKQ